MDNYQLPITNYGMDCLFQDQVIKLPNDSLAQLSNHPFIKSPIHQITKLSIINYQLSNYQITKLSNYQIIKLPNYQITAVRNKNEQM